ncbi:MULTISPECIES: cell division protein ZapA [Salinivibrio]|jgi:cell division protein ZapA|uniref:cell division protein ZapA n=1 Tax=Salinivibrio TaxID=51366 RepID=UPI00084CAC2F|nr:MULTISPECIES: cell division protein ZapA [Salinivibrio]ODP98759.1 Z-ring-associated protein [Salinivibrio sp. DV]OOF11495.1 cell division protein ZapA [Salinivibrio sp. PR5]OOF13898.1 cell division protein ZapA [Salinivibrio sp. PR919]OOF19188.1 cell division protein ZapA [Salinivibrio sp. PR932]OOF24273.1 cell division protein ZapA [Salinivibrio sp. IB574]
MSTQPVEIKILDRFVRVNCPPGQEQALKEAASEFDQRLQQLAERTKVTNTEQLIAIAALNVCHELNEAKQSLVDVQDQVKQRSALMASKLDTAMATQGPRK